VSTRRPPVFASSGAGGLQPGDRVLSGGRWRYVIKCACCGTVGIHKARDWINACYQRWERAGQPLEGPPPPPPDDMDRWTAARMIRLQHAADRYREYARLRGLRYSPLQAVRRIGLKPRSARVYEARLRAQKEIA
jgi:hypothetical protein